MANYYAFAEIVEADMASVVQTDPANMAAFTVGGVPTVTMQTVVVVASKTDIAAAPLATLAAKRNELRDAILQLVAAAKAGTGVYVGIPQFSWQETADNVELSVALRLMPVTDADMLAAIG